MSIAALQGDQRLPLYQRLADVLRAEILCGDRRPGDRLPSENVLARDYGIAPGTTRKALAELVEDGILERLQGRGTFVRRPSFDRSLFRFFRLRTKSGADVIPDSQIRSRTVRRMPSEIARKLAQPDACDGIRMVRMRLIDGVPILHEEIWLPLTPFAAFMELDLTEVGPLLYPIYDTCCDQIVARADELLTVDQAKGQPARLLELEAGAPLVCIERLACSLDGTPIEWRRSRGAAEHFQYQIEIR
ncbi:MAG: GntR family transcriptional regulator [Pseudomonadota bacterium]